MGASLQDVSVSGQGRILEADGPSARTEAGSARWKGTSRSLSGLQFPDGRRCARKEIADVSPFSLADRELDITVLSSLGYIDCGIN